MYHVYDISFLFLTFISERYKEISGFLQKDKIFSWMFLIMSHVYVMLTHFNKNIISGYVLCYFRLCPMLITNICLCILAWKPQAILYYWHIFREWYALLVLKFDCYVICVLWCYCITFIQTEAYKVYTIGMKCVQS